MGSSGPRDSIYAPFVRLRFKRLFDGRLPFCTLSFGSVLNFWQHVERLHSEVPVD